MIALNLVLTSIAGIIAVMSLQKDLKSEDKNIKDNTILIALLIIGSTFGSGVAQFIDHADQEAQKSHLEDENIKLKNQLDTVKGNILSDIKKATNLLDSQFDQFHFPQISMIAILELRDYGLHKLNI